MMSSLPIEEDAFRSAIAKVIDVEFRDALMTTNEIKRSMSDYLESADREFMIAA